MVKFAIITGGTRGIGKGISQILAADPNYDGLLLTYNTNVEAAKAFASELESQHKIKVKIAGGDLSTVEARDGIFGVADEFITEGYGLATMVHNAGQYVGLTSDNAMNLPAANAAGGGMAGMKFGDGSLLKEDGSLDTSYMEYYQALYGTAFVDLCERSLARMKKAHEECQAKGDKYRGSIIGISSPGCNANFKCTPGYDMPGSGKCIMEYAIRLYALEAAKYGINANVIIPGFTRSDAWGKIAEGRGMERDAFMDRLKDQLVPLGEIVEATDIGETVAFLSGNGGGRFMTGLSLRVDGGLHLK